MAETQEEKITRLEAKLLKYKEIFAIKDHKIRRLKHHVSILKPLAAVADRAWGSGGDAEMRNLRKQVIAQLRDCIKAHGPITEEWLYSATKRVLRPFIQYFADRVDNEETHMKLAIGFWAGPVPIDSFTLSREVTDDDTEAIAKFLCAEAKIDREWLHTLLVLESDTLITIETREVM